METPIRKIGNSKGIIIPCELLNKLNLDINDIIDVKIENGCMVCEPIRKPKYSLDELLNQCEASDMVLDKKDEAWLNSPPVGKEVI